MFANIFPKPLAGLFRLTCPRHRLAMVLLPLISPQEYALRIGQVPAERLILSMEEIEKAKSFPSEKRQREWLTGRVCAKSAALHYHNSNSRERVDLALQNLRVANAESGRPFLSGEFSPTLATADLSISHGAGYGLALLADGPCGADIQHPDSKLVKVREKFCSIEEQEILLNFLPELPELQQLNLLWTAKEAAKKALSQIRMPGFFELLFTAAEPRTGGWLLTFIVSKKEYSDYPATITVVSELYEDFGLSLCLLKEDSDA